MYRGRKGGRGDEGNQQISAAGAGRPAWRGTHSEKKAAFKCVESLVCRHRDGREEEACGAGAKSLSLT